MLQASHRMLRDTFFSGSCQVFPKQSQFKNTHLFIPKDNFLRGDSSRKVQHQQQRKPRKKTKPPALTKKHKKKRRRGPRRPQKPIPPAVPQGNLSMPTSVSLPVEAAQIRSVMAEAYVSFLCLMVLRTSSFTFFSSVAAGLQKPFDRSAQALQFSSIIFTKYLIE